MSLNAVNLLEHVIKPTLNALDMPSLTAENILLNIAAEASGFNPFYQHCSGHQRHSGVGIYRISAEQHRRVWDDYLAFRPELASKVRGLASQRQFLVDPDGELETNLAYSTAIAWMLYLQMAEAPPARHDAA